MASRNAVQRAIDAYGRARFEEKRSGSWVRQSGVIEQTLNLQKSQYSVRYYLNVEFAFGAGDERGGIMGRAEDLLEDADAERLEALLDIDDNPMEDEHREHELALVLERLTPLFADLSSVEAVASHDRRGTFRSMGVTGPARAAIDRVLSPLG